MTDDHTDTSLISRRRLLRAMGVSTAGVAAASAIAASREKIVDAGDTAKEELAELKKQFDALDKRFPGVDVDTRILVRVLHANPRRRRGYHTVDARAHETPERSCSC